MDSESDFNDKIANFLTSKKLVFLGPGLSPCDHHEAMIYVVKELRKKFTINNTATNNTTPARITRPTYSGQFEAIAIIPQVASKKPANIGNGHISEAKISVEKESKKPVNVEPETEDEEEEEDDPVANATVNTPEEKKETVKPNPSVSEEDKPKLAQNIDIHSFGAVHDPRNGGWLKVLVAIAKDLKANPKVPRADPMKIEFKNPSSKKGTKVSFRLDDIKAFASLYEQHGDKIKDVYQMTPEEYHGDNMLKSVDFHKNEYPSYTRIETRGRMFAPCIAKHNGCLRATVVDRASYINGERIWSDAYQYESRTCSSCNKVERSKQ